MFYKSLRRNLSLLNVFPYGLNVIQIYPLEIKYRWYVLYAGLDYILCLMFTFTDCLQGYFHNISNTTNLNIENDFHIIHYIILKFETIFGILITRLLDTNNIIGEG